MKINFRLLTILLLISAMLASGAPSPSPPYPVENFAGESSYPVLKVTDGDTIDIQYKGEAEEVRLIGIDTPETVHPNKPVEPYGKEASNFTKNLLLGESVYLKFDGKRRGPYRRLRAYVYRATDGLFVNLEIIRQGYGRADKDPDFAHKHQKLFQDYELKAIQAEKGLHGTLPPTAPIKIASWNLKDFSYKNFNPEVGGSRSLEHVVNILKGYQVIAIQEVVDRKIIDTTVNLLKDKGFNYGSQITREKVGNGRYKEHYVFLYDKDRIKLSKDGKGKVHYGEEAAELERDPYYATFEVKEGGFDFTLITFHAVFEEEKRSKEVKALASVFIEIQNADKDEQDIILLGDFNFDPAKDKGYYRHEGAYDPLLTEAKMALDFPLKSLVSGRGLVDNIFYHEKHTKEYSGISGVTAFGPDIGLSDHYLIWAEFKIPIPSEDDD